MRDFIIVTDSAADLPEEYIKENGIITVPFYVTFDGVDYYRENVDITQREFFEKLSSGLMPKTSCPSVNDYEKAFKLALSQGKGVICFCISSKLSGSCQSARAAAGLFNASEEKIFVVDSRLATVGQALLVHQCVKMQRDRLDIKAAYKLLEQLKATGGINFIVDDLTHLQKGGRIGKAAALMGTLLSIKPIIRLKDGELLPVAKLRGRKNAAAKVKELTQEVIAAKGDSYDYAVVGFTQNGDIDDYSALLNRWALPPVCIGSTVGAHTGPTAAGIGFIEGYRPKG